MLVLHGFTMQNYDLRGKIGFECVEIAINGSQRDVFKDIINVHQIFLFLINVAIVMVQKMDLGDVFPFYLTQEEDEDDEDGWMDG